MRLNAAFKLWHWYLHCRVSMTSETKHPFKIQLFFRTTQIFHRLDPSARNPNEVFIRQLDLLYLVNSCLTYATSINCYSLRIGNVLHKQSLCASLCEIFVRLMWILVCAHVLFFMCVKCVILLCYVFENKYDKWTSIYVLTLYSNKAYYKKQGWKVILRIGLRKCPPTMFMLTWKCTAQVARVQPVTSEVLFNLFLVMSIKIITSFSKVISMKLNSLAHTKIKMCVCVCVWRVTAGSVRSNKLLHMWEFWH